MGEYLPTIATFHLFCAATMVDKFDDRGWWCRWRRVREARRDWARRSEGKPTRREFAWMEEAKRASVRVSAVAATNGGFGCRSCQATEVSRRRGPLSLTLAHTSHPARGRRRGRRSLASRGDRGVEAARARTRHLTRVSQSLLNLYRSNLMRVRPPTHAHPASARVEQQQLEKSRSPPCKPQQLVHLLKMRADGTQTPQANARTALYAHRAVRPSMRRGQLISDALLRARADSNDLDDRRIRNIRPLIPPQILM